MGAWRLRRELPDAFIKETRMFNDHSYGGHCDDIASASGAP